jgi:HPt (histidine-containing phosphotransfer) domain-containing protein
LIVVPWNISLLATRQDNNPDVVEFLALFSSEFSKSVRKFHEAALKEDLSQAMGHCHRMRGSAAIYGFTKLSECLLEAENLIAEGWLLPSLITGYLVEVAAVISSTQWKESCGY